MTLGEFTHINVIVSFDKCTHNLEEAVEVSEAGTHVADRRYGILLIILVSLLVFLNQLINYLWCNINDNSREAVILHGLQNPYLV